MKRQTKRALENIVENILSPFDLHGGSKGMWLKQHRGTILDYLQIFGEAATMEKFKMENTTLDNLKADPTPYWQKKTHAETANIKADTALNAIEKLERKVEGLVIRIESLSTSNHDSLKAIKEIKEQSALFQETIINGLAEKVFRPLIQNFKLPESLETKPQPDPLDLRQLELKRDILSEAEDILNDSNNPKDILEEKNQQFSDDDYIRAIHNIFEELKQYRQREGRKDGDKKSSNLH